ncbi:hypothetical protein Cfor_02053, partial [Coptotermes formosanus]
RVVQKIQGRSNIHGKDPRSRWLSTSTDDDSTERFRAVIHSHRRLIIRKVADECRVSVEWCHTTLTEELNAHRVAAKFVPCPLIDAQKKQRVAISQELLHRATTKKSF